MFRLHLYTAYITTAKVSIIVFICLFQDNIWIYYVFFLIRCSGSSGCLCISYAPILVMIFLIISVHPLGFMYICLAGFQGQTCSHLCFLHCFPLYFLIHMGAHFCINMVSLPPTCFGIIKNQNSYYQICSPTNPPR